MLGVPWVAAIPFRGHDEMWNSEYRRIYIDLLSNASAVHILSEGPYDPEKMQARNRWMVDQCTTVLALWNGDASGTGNCVRYAQERGKPVDNAWGRWLMFNAQ